MRFRPGRLLVSLVVVMIVVLAFVIIWRARSDEAYGPAVALCPGPDRYGYTCEGAAAYVYIDATTPTGLVADDAVIRLNLPFPFLFYGTDYNAVTVSANGNLQFSSSSSLAFPACLTPATGLGDLISPYWADLDLTLFGALETAVVGESPSRIFVVEWDDVPLYGIDPDDRVTFEAQLFEGSNDIVFLYQDPATVAGGNGGRAVVGIQSEARGAALSFSCLQPVLPAAGGLRFPHPAEPNLDAGEPDEAAGVVAPSPDVPAAKGVVADLIARYGSEGPAALDRLRLHLLNEQRPQAFNWRSADLTGDGRDELVALWRGRAADPHVARVAVLEIDGGRLEPLIDRPLSTRLEGYSEVVIEEVIDLTGDGRVDVVLRDRPTARVWVLAIGGAAPILFDVPERCNGSLVARDDDGDGRPAIVRDGCPLPGRIGVEWDGAEFSRVP